MTRGRSESRIKEASTLRWHGDREEGPDMGRPTQNGCKRPGWDEPARLTTVGKAEPLRGGLASESRISEGLPPDPSSGAGDPTPPTRAFEPAAAAAARVRESSGWPAVPGYEI